MCVTVKKYIIYSVSLWYLIIAYLIVRYSIYLLHLQKFLFL